MATTEPYFSLVKTSASSWAAVLVSSEESMPTTEMQNPYPAETAPYAVEAGTLLFANATASPAGLTERFPRLAIAMVTFLIFAVSLSAEIEYLRQSGFSLR